MSDLNTALARQLGDIQKQLMGLVKSQTKAMQQQQDMLLAALERMWKGERRGGKTDSMTEALAKSLKKSRSRTFGSNY